MASSNEGSATRSVRASDRPARSAKARAASKKPDRETRVMILLGLAVVALAASVILAVGALLAALSADTQQPLVGAVSAVSDLLVGPLDGLFSFSGDGALDRQRLISRGVASMIYLGIGLVLPGRISRSAR